MTTDDLRTLAAHISPHLSTDVRDKLFAFIETLEKRDLEFAEARVILARLMEIMGESRCPTL